MLIFGAAFGRPMGVTIALRIKWALGWPISRASFIAMFHTGVGATQGAIGGGVMLWQLSRARAKHREGPSHT